MVEGMVLWAGPETLLPLPVWSGLQEAGYTVTTVPDQASALQIVSKRAPEVVVAAQTSGDGFLLEFLERIRTDHPETPVLVIASEPRVEEAVESMKRGASDYLPSSATPEYLMARLVASLAASRGDHLGRKTERPPSPLRDRRIIGQDPLTRKVLDLARKVAPSRSPILIQGETGTGKELIARHIHALSGRGEKPLVAVNCAALPEHLLESELFGHEKGAFTGAVTRRLGKFELAHRGSLLLDEISEMALGLQAKLLRVLQEGELDRLGGQQSVPVDTRILATTNRNLEEMVGKNAFRQDLFYRLNVVRLVLPPLRERREDILPLARYIIEKSCALNNRPSKRLTVEAEVALVAHPWPGNVRELENTIERAVLLTEGDLLRPEELFEEGVEHPEPGATPVSGLNLRDMEQRLIYTALDRHGGNRTHAAKALGISVRTLRNKLNEYRAEVHAEEPGEDVP
jgi:DNA-binding NtrC family response regulator